MAQGKVNNRIQFLATDTQKEKLNLIRFYSGKTVGQILRQLVDQLDPEDFKEENHV